MERPNKCQGKNKTNGNQCNKAPMKAPYKGNWLCSVHNDSVASGAQAQPPRKKRSTRGPKAWSDRGKKREAEAQEKHEEQQDALPPKLAFEPNLKTGKGRIELLERVANEVYTGTIESREAEALIKIAVAAKKEMGDGDDTGESIVINFGLTSNREEADDIKKNHTTIEEIN